MNRAIIDKALESLFLAEACGATELLLIRHAEPARDVECAGGGLSTQGRLQAFQLGQELRAAGITAVYSAGSAAATETATAIAAQCDIKGEVIEELAPIGVQDAQGVGMPWDAAGFGVAVEMAAHQFCCYPRWDSLPGLETGRLFRRRVIGTLEAIAARHPGQTVAVVTHSCAINAYLSMVLDIPRDFFFAPAPASVSAVRIKGDRYGLRYINGDGPSLRRNVTESNLV